MGRGPGPRDKKIFGSSQQAKLSAAVLDLSLLLERHYTESSALKLVGDRYQLLKRQRQAVLRCAAGPSQIAVRLENCLPREKLRGKSLIVDGFNLLILLEAAVGGGVILHGADSTFRDLSSVHGSYRMVEQTPDVIAWVGRWCAQYEVREVLWLFDSPVSNSGKLAALVRQTGEAHQWPWRVETTPFVDQQISESNDVSVTSDKVILERCQRWCNLGRWMIESAWEEGKLPKFWRLDLPQPQERGILFAVSDVFSASARM